MGSYLKNAPEGELLRVQVVYTASILGSDSEIERMGPAQHLPAGYRKPDEAAGWHGYKYRVGEVVASRFAQTAGDEMYDFGYLAAEHDGDERYLPARDMPDDYEGDGYLGRRRIWVGNLSYPEWRVFADRYIIELDERGLPAGDYEDVWGGPSWDGPVQVSVDNTDGWESPRALGHVIDSSFQLAFMFAGTEAEEES